MRTRWEQELLDDLYADLDDYGRRIPRPSPPGAVVSWPPPRGPRDADGWRWSLTSRPDASYVNDLERRSVRGYRALAAELRDARNGPPAVSLRRLSLESQTALSVLTGMEQGSAWPSFLTVSMAAEALGRRVQVAGPRVQAPGEQLVDPARVEKEWGVDAGNAVAVPWQLLIVLELRHRMLAAGLSKSALARAVGLRHNTVTEMYHTKDFRFVNVRTLAAMCAHLDTRLELVPRNEPWA